MDLPLVWAVLIAFAVFAYVVLDGFDLGIGLLFPFLGSREERDTAMASVAPVWDGNETWLVLGGGGLLAVFPLAYGILLTALYPLIIAMLIGLILRGVAFEFRWRSERHRPLWDLAFTGGSLIAALAQGIMLGAVIQGVEVTGRTYAGGWLDWLTPFSLLTGAALVIGYALLGAGWLAIKTVGSLQDAAFRMAMPLALGLVAAIVLVSAWTPFLDRAFLDRWLSWPAIVYVAPVPILTALCAWWLVTSIRARREREPFVATLGLFALSYVGLGISLYPYIVPARISIWDAAAPPESLGFLLVGAVVLIPLILGYTAYAYWIFRGKVRPGEGYH